MANAIKKSEHNGPKNGGGAWMKREDAKHQGNRVRREDDKAAVLVEDVHMGDWLRVGPRAVEEVLISHNTDNPCAVAREMRDAGQKDAPIFRSLIAACREYRKEQGR
jgi:hypothetical protein